MSKVNIEFKLVSNEDNIIKKIDGILQNNRLSFYDDNIKTSLIINDIITMKRETKDYIIELNFDKNNTTKGTYLLLNHNISLDLIIDTIKLEKKDDYLNIKYHLLVSNEDKGIYNLELKYKNNK